MNNKEKIPDFGKLVADIFSPLVPQAQPYDISESGQFYSLEIAVPGYKKKDIEIDIVNNLLVVKGSNQRPSIDYSYTGLVYGDFVQKFTLPDSLSGDIKAKLEDGILKIVMPKGAKGSSKIRID